MISKSFEETSSVGLFSLSSLAAISCLAVAGVAAVSSLEAVASSLARASPAASSFLVATAGVWVFGSAASVDDVFVDSESDSFLVYTFELSLRVFYCFAKLPSEVNPESSISSIWSSGS